MIQVIVIRLMVPKGVSLNPLYVPVTFLDKARDGFGDDVL
jgi:hypothetical protein